MRQFVTVRRAFASNEFAQANKMSEKNHIYDSSITADFTAFTDIRTGVVITGLKTKEEEIEWETKLRLPAGTLAPDSDFWYSQKMRVRLDGVSSKIYIDDDLGMLKYKMIKAQPIVASSTVKYNPEKHKFIIYEPEIEAEIELTKINVELEASEEFAKLTTEEIKELSTFYKISTRGVPDGVAKANLFKEMKKSPKKFLQLKKDPYYQTKLFINNCVKESVIKQTNKGYFWMDDTIVPIAYNLDQFVEMLESKDNQDLKIRLKQELAQAIKKNK